MKSTTKIIPDNQTLGDGNCLLNAVFLAYFTEENLRQVGAYLKKQKENADLVFKEFIELAIKEIADLKECAHTWDAVTAALLEMKKRDKSNFQRCLAPVGRALIGYLAVEEDRKKDGQHQKRTIPSLTAAFRIYVLNQLSGTTAPEDAYDHYAYLQSGKFKELFSEVKETVDRTSFPVAQFNELRATKNRSKEQEATYKTLENTFNEALEPTSAKLVDWWSKGKTEGKSSGYSAFLKEKQQPGQWLTDLELKLFGYFRANIRVHFKDNLKSFHYAHIEPQTIPDKFNEKQIKQLKIRGVVAPEKGSLERLPLAKEEIRKRVGAIPKADKLESFLDRQEAGAPLTGVALPAGFGEDGKKELIQRNVINRTPSSNSLFTFNNLSTEDLKERIQAVENDAEVIRELEESHVEIPVISVVNADNKHWMCGNEVPIPYVENDIYQSTLKQLSVAKKEDAGKKWIELVNEIDASAEQEKLVAKNRSLLPEEAKTLIAYSVNPEDVTETKSVVEETQVDLDARLAQELQEKFYAEFQSHDEEQVKTDEALARRLSGF